MNELNLKKIFTAIRKNAIQIHYEKAESQLTLGLSKIGGKPHLPNGFAWPYFEGNSYDGGLKNRPLAFLAQINLLDVKAFDQDSLLPDMGMLYFFYEVETMLWGFDPEDKGCARVFYHGGECSNLVVMDFPDDFCEDSIIPEQRLSFASTMNLPSYEEFDAHYEEDCDWDGYDEVRKAFGCPVEDRPEDQIKLLGYADLIQREMLEECERVSVGIYCGDGRAKCSKEQEEELAKHSKEWMMLFQMGTVKNEHFELMWGDCGCIYFYIKKKDLKERNFDDVWLILQCY